MSMVKTVFTTEKFIGDVVSRLMQRYDRVLVERDESDGLICRAIAAHLSFGVQEDDFGRTNPIVPASLTDPPPNCS